jgi:hypothetical protein
MKNKLQIGDAHAIGYVAIIALTLIMYKQAHELRPRWIFMSFACGLVFSAFGISSLQ